MRTTGSQAAAAARIGAGLGRRKRVELLAGLRPCFCRTEPWLQAGKYLDALMSELPRRNGWTIAEHAGDRTPDRTQRLLNRAAWDTPAAMGVVRRFAVAGLDEAARLGGRGAGLRVGALDETGQEKKGQATAGVKRQHMGCAGGVDNGINTVHLSYIREGTGHALIGARQWIPREHIEDPVRSLITGLPPELAFRTKGQLAGGIFAGALGDGVRLDFVCGDEVYGSCTELRELLQEHEQAYVLRVPSSFSLTLADGIRLTCAGVARQLLRDASWEVRSAGHGSKGSRWYAWAWLGTASVRHYLLVRRHLRTGDLAFHYCYVPGDGTAGISSLIRAAGLRWPVEEDFQFSKGCFGLDQSQVRLYTAIARHTVLVMAALAICAVTAARLRHRAGTRAPQPARPDQQPPPDLGMTPLTVPEIHRLLSARATVTRPPGHAEHWLEWRRRHQARARWYHQRARLAREITMVR